MNGFETTGGWIRYALAVLTVVTLPPAFLWWFVIHPFAHRLRRFGPAKTFAVLVPSLLVVCFGLLRFRGALVGPDWGWHPVLFGAGLALYALAFRIELRVRRHLTFRILAGVPELSREPGRLLSEGIYSQLRHPRYMAVFVGLLAFALMLNYAGLYVLTAVSVPALAAVIKLEERELLDRFGEEYQAYRGRVPAVVPRTLGFLREATDPGVTHD